MRPLALRFYRIPEDDAETGPRPRNEPGGGRLEPLDALRPVAEVLFKRHLAHLGFFVSRHYPGLEGRKISAEVEFRKENGKPRMPVLLAIDDGKPLARLPCPLSSFDMEPFQSVITRRHPEVKGEDLIFTLGPLEEEESK